MRNIFLATVALLALLAMGAVAGDYHRTTTLICMDCHIMHASQSHTYDGASMTPYTATPNAKLLRNNVNDLCLSCHNNQSFAPDVLEGNGGAGAANGRQAGGLNRVGGTWSEEHGHTLGATSTAPGGTFTPDPVEGLECTNCHGAHGSAGYRNLGPYGSTMYKPTYAVGATCDYTKDVWELQAAAYDQDSVYFPEPSPTMSGYGQMCQSCHTNFHGNTTTSNMYNGADWVRHPAADADMAISATSRFATENYRAKVLMAAGTDFGTPGTPLGVATTITPSCFTCHKGHGNQNPFGLIFATGNNAPGENGDGTHVKNTCNQCHGMGRV